MGASQEFDCAGFMPTYSAGFIPDVARFIERYSAFASGRPCAGNTKNVNYAENEQICRYVQLCGESTFSTK